MGYRHRRMYYATGMPGWLRFGYSPGWLGRSPTGLPPMAQWITSSGAMPQYQQYPGAGPLTKEQEVAMLEQQARQIEQQIAAVRRRVDEVRSGSETGQSQPHAYPFMTHPYMDWSSFPHHYPPMYEAPLSSQEELASLEDYRKHLDEEAKGVEARIDELKRQVRQDEAQPSEEEKGGE